MGDDAMIALVASECEHAIGDTKEVPEMLRKAFKAAKGHWMVLQPDPQLKGALAAVLRKMGEDHPDYERLTTDIKLLGQFNAWLQAAQSGLEVMPPTIPDGHETFGIMKLWHEAA